MKKILFILLMMPFYLMAQDSKKVSELPAATDPDSDDIMYFIEDGTSSNITYELLLQSVNDSVDNLGDSIAVFRDSINNYWGYIVNLNDTVDVFRDSLDNYWIYIDNINDTLDVFRDSIDNYYVDISALYDSIATHTDTLEQHLIRIIALEDTIPDYGLLEQIPFMDAAGDNFDYETGFQWTGSALSIPGGIEHYGGGSDDIGSTSEYWYRVYANLLYLENTTYLGTSGLGDSLMFYDPQYPSGVSLTTIMNGISTELSFGLVDQIPFTNAATDDFDYSANLKYDGDLHVLNSDVYVNTAQSIYLGSSSIYEVAAITTDLHLSDPTAGDVTLSELIGYFDRIGTSLSPKTSGDDIVPYGTADLGASGTEWNNVYTDNIYSDYSYFSNANTYIYNNSGDMTFRDVNNTGGVSLSDLVDGSQWTSYSGYIEPKTSGDDVRPNGTATLGANGDVWSEVHSNNYYIAGGYRISLDGSFNIKFNTGIMTTGSDDIGTSGDFWGNSYIDHMYVGSTNAYVGESSDILQLAGGGSIGITIDGGSDITVYDNLLANGGEDIGTSGLAFGDVHYDDVLYEPNVNYSGTIPTSAYTPAAGVRFIDIEPMTGALYTLQIDLDNLEYANDGAFVYISYKWTNSSVGIEIRDSGNNVMRSISGAPATQEGGWVFSWDHENDRWNSIVMTSH